MAKISFLKPKETPAPPELIEVEKQAVEAMEEVEREVAEAQEAGEAEEVRDVKEAEGTTVQEPVMTPSVSATPAQPADPFAQRIETILEEDLTDMYLKMSPKDQVFFKQKGEETVSKIRELMTKTKVNAKKIFELVREWLKLIPGVNRFFLEQEAKIKTDKILFTKEHE